MFAVYRFTVLKLVLIFSVFGLLLCLPLLGREVAAVSASNVGEKKVAYLTFDDGPSENTVHLLSVLRRHGVKATFFLIGPVPQTSENYNELLAAIAADGHSLAPHSYVHDYNKIYSSPESFAADLKKIKTSIENVTGGKSSLYRFPGGSVNREAPKWVLDAAVDELTRQNIVYYDWNIVSGDDTAIVYSPQTLCSNVMDEVGKFREAVVLFHDASLCSTTADAVDLLITGLKKDDWQFKAILPGTVPIQFHAAK